MLVLNFSDSLLAALPGEIVCFGVGTFEPGFGIPLDDGIKLSFLAAAVLLPFGIKLAILEVFFWSCLRRHLVLLFFSRLVSAGFILVPGLFLFFFWLQQRLFIAEIFASCFRRG